MSLDVKLSVPDRGVDVEFGLDTGRTLALLGPNGTGKSTILDVVAGLLRPHDGRVIVDGRVQTEIRDGRTETFVRPHQRGIALLAQEPLLFPHLSALENVAFGPRSAGVARGAARETARAWLQRVHTEDLADRRPREVSGGQAQRIALARALATDPDVVLLDEPLAALDAQIAPALRSVLKEVLAARTTLLVTHDLIDALLLADDVAVIEDGSIVEHGPALDVLTRPRSAFAAHLADLNMAVGVADESAVRLDDGQRVQGSGDVADGTAAVAVFRPGAVSIFREPPGGSPRNHLRVRVSEIEPHSGGIRVRAGDFSADVTTASLAELALEPGDDVVFAVKATEVTVYPR